MVHAVRDRAVRAGERRCGHAQNLRHSASIGESQINESELTVRDTALPGTLTLKTNSLGPPFLIAFPIVRINWFHIASGFIRYQRYRIGSRIARKMTDEISRLDSCG